MKSIPLWVYKEVKSCEELSIGGRVSVASQYELEYTLTKKGL